MNYAADSQTCLARLLSQSDLSGLNTQDKAVFTARLERHFEQLLSLYTQVYGHQYDCYFHLQQLLTVLADGFKSRSRQLKNQDQQAIASPLWYRSEQEVGMACYVDLMGPTLDDLHDKIPYLKSLGVTYLHLMPLYASPEGDSDGGYAVSDYRKVNPSLGTMSQLKKLAKALDKAGIRLILDFVFNHTSDEHAWAKAALRGDDRYQNFYYLFDDRTLPDQFEQTLREIFPQVRRGSFTFNEQMQKWVWTTFNSFQWDLNYRNPDVFNAITAEMLFLANIGCAGLRLDALAFIWKEMGTDCENQPMAHTLIQTFNCCLQIVAPSVVFKSEAIVHPDEVVKYVRKDECQLSYNPLLMALLWNSMATRKTNLLTRSMQKSFAIPQDTTWVNYIRCHDDIGWTFDDAVAWDMGVNPHDHRYFLNQFFTGRFEGSFAQGVPFAENPTTGDCRVCGTLASLCGLEQALQDQDQSQIDVAVARMVLLYGVTFSIGGIPLLYSSDELGLLNDHSYLEDEAKKHDDRWVNRVAVTPNDISHISCADDPESLEVSAKRQVFTTLQKLIFIRKSHRVFGDSRTQILDTGNQHCFAYLRTNSHNEKLLVVCNFSEHPQQISGQLLQLLEGQNARDLITSHHLDSATAPLTLTGYQQQWWLAE